VNEVRDAEERLAKADHAAAVALLARDVAGSNVLGQWLNRAATEATRQPYRQAGDLEFRALGRDTVAVVGAAVGAASSATQRYLHVWTKRDGRWQLVAFHETAVAPDGSRKPLEVSSALVDARLTESATGREDEVRRAERERRSVFVAHSAERYTNLATEDYLTILVTGAVEGRTKRAAFVPTHFVYDTSNMAVTILGDDVGVVRADQTSADGPMKITRLWIKRDDRWRVAAHAGSLVAQVNKGPA
jgi:ketosteroid isomerase-like protein